MKNSILTLILIILIGCGNDKQSDSGASGGSSEPAATESAPTIYSVKNFYSPMIDGYQVYINNLDAVALDTPTASFNILVGGISCVGTLVFKKMGYTNGYHFYFYGVQSNYTDPGTGNLVTNHPNCDVIADSFWFDLVGEYSTSIEMERIP